MDISSQLNEKGQLEVAQRFVNDSPDRVSFRFQLFAPGRRRLKAQVIGLDHGQDLKIYRLADGRELIGKDLWLRAEEIDGPRSLNYRLTVNP